MKVLQVMRSSGAGGIESHVLVLAERLRERGHDLRVVTPRGGWLARECAALGIGTTSLRMRGTYDVGSVLSLARLLRVGSFDLVHAHATRGTFYSVLAARLAGVPVVASAHSTNTHRYFRFARRVIAVSQAVRQHLMDSGVPDSRIEVIYNGVDAGRYLTAGADRTAARRGLNIAEKQFTVAVVGRLGPTKGQDTALRAMALLRNWNIDALCLLAGQDDTPGAPAIRRLRADLHLESCVQILGYREDVPQILAAADVVAAPSRREAFGIGVMEAMATGRPVVASRIGGLPELVQPGVNGALVPPGDARALAESLRDLYQHAAERLRMGEQARQIALEQFTNERMVGRVEGVYAALHSGHSHSARRRSKE